VALIIGSNEDHAWAVSPSAAQELEAWMLKREPFPGHIFPKDTKPDPIPSTYESFPPFQPNPPKPTPKKS